MAFDCRRQTKARGSCSCSGAPAESCSQEAAAALRPPALRMMTCVLMGGGGGGGVFRFCRIQFACKREQQKSVGRVDVGVYECAAILLR